MMASSAPAAHHREIRLFAAEIASVGKFYGGAYVNLDAFLNWAAYILHSLLFHVLTNLLQLSHMVMSLHSCAFYFYHFPLLALDSLRRSSLWFHRMLLSCCSQSCKCGNLCVNKPFQYRPVKKMKLIEVQISIRWNCSPLLLDILFGGFISMAFCD